MLVRRHPHVLRTNRPIPGRIAPEMARDDFERLYREHAEALLGFLSYRTGDRMAAEDIAADTFERALRGRAKFDPRRGNERAWLFTIARNLLTDRMRRDHAE